GGLDAESGQGLPKVLGVAQAAERRDARMPQRRDWNRLAGSPADPGLGTDARMKDLSIRIVSAQQVLGARHHAPRLAAGDDENSAARQAIERFAQAPQWQRIAAAERVERIHQHNIQPAMNARMLKSVIQHHHVDVELALQQSAHVPTLGSYPHWSNARPE